MSEKNFGTALFHSLMYTVFLLVTVNYALAVDTCIDCHKNENFRIQNKKLFDYYRNWEGSPHDVAGISCSDCHGGNDEEISKEKAHKNILSPTMSKSSVFFKNIPKTCGTCHQNVYENFIKSKHYQSLERKGKGPNCITCHGSVNTMIRYSSIVVTTCVNCHNQKTGNHPEIIGKAEKILSRLNISKGFIKWSSLYYKSINRSDMMLGINAQYKTIADSWHRFNFENMEEDSEKLLSDLRYIYKIVLKEKREKKK